MMDGKATGEVVEVGWKREKKRAASGEEEMKDWERDTSHAANTSEYYRC